MDFSAHCILGAGLLLCLWSMPRLVEGDAWGYYAGLGPPPDEWYTTYPACSGSSQSPVNIVRAATTEDPGLGPITFTGYDVQGMCNVTNDGHSASVYSDQAASISAGGLDKEYAFHNFHTHWGSSNTNGSGHWLNDMQYSAEIHIVHIHNESYTFAVLSVLVQVGSINHAAFQQLVEALPDATYRGDSGVGFPLRLGDILPSNRDVFYRYEGSMTGPPCLEVVTWTVFKDHIYVSQSQMDALRGLYRGNASVPVGNIVDTFRPVQPLNNRTVLLSVDPVPPVTMTTTTTVMTRPTAMTTATATTTATVMTTAGAPSPVTGLGVVLGSVLAAVWAMQWSD